MFQFSLVSKACFRHRTLHVSQIEFNELSFAQCQGNPDSGMRQIFACGIRNRGNSVQGIRNPINDRNHGNQV